MTNQPSIIRVEHGKDNPYLMMHRATPQDERLSWESRGVLAYLLSKPDDWSVDPKDLEQNCGKTKVYGILKELQEYRYVKVVTPRDDKGRITSWNYTVFERPYEPLPTNQEVGLQEVDTQEQGQQVLAKPHHTYKRNTQKKELTKEPEIKPNGLSQVASTSSPNGQYVPPLGYERLWMVHHKTDARFEHLVNGAAKSPGLTCRRCKLKLNDGIESRVKPIDYASYERCLGKEPKAAKARASPKPRKPSSDLTDAMHESIPEIIRPPGKPHYAKNTVPADDLYNAGFTADRIRAYVTWAYVNDKWFCCGGPGGTPVMITMHEVKNKIKAWESTHARMATAADSSDYVSEIDTTKGKLYAVPAK